MQFFHSMSLALLLWPYLLLLLPPLTWAGPPSTESLTPALQDVVPPCAQTCLEFFIAENFPSSICGPPPNIDCLCTSDSTSGFTVGEGALECLFTGCGAVYDSRALAAYDVCAAIANAKPNTHGTLTATLSPVTPSIPANPVTQTSSHSSTSISTFSTSRRSSSFTTTPSTSSKLSQTITTSSSSASKSSSSSSLSASSSSSRETSQSVIPPPGGIITSATSSLSSNSPATSAIAAPASSPTPALTKPQIAGVAVASVGAAAVGFGICFLVFCLRRRRKSERRQSGSSFGGDKIVGSEETTPDMALIATRDFGHENQTRQPLVPRQQRSPTRQLRLETPASSSEDGWGQYQRNLRPELALGPQAPRSIRDGHSPITPASNQTRNSQLLPDKPTYNLFPPPSRPTARNSIPNQSVKLVGSSPKPPVPPLGSPFSRAAQQHPSSLDTSQAHLQGRGVPSGSNFDPFVDPASRSPPSIYPYFRESRQRPPAAAATRSRFRVPSWEQPPSAGVVRKPVPTYQPYRAENTVGAPVHSDQQAVGTGIYNHRRKSSRKKSVGSRPMTVFSNGSETSFESLGDEEDESPDPRSALSPVAEVRSPPSGRVSYPAIPPSAAESPTRRPQERSVHPAQPDSLLSKRLGRDKAREIAGRLQSPSRRSQDEGTPQSGKWKVLVSPGLRGADRSGSPPTAKGAVKSPPTPWRR